MIVSYTKHLIAKHTIVASRNLMHKNHKKVFRPIFVPSNVNPAKKIACSRHGNECDCLCFTHVVWPVSFLTVLQVEVRSSDNFKTILRQSLSRWSFFSLRRNAFDHNQRIHRICGQLKTISDHCKFFFRPVRIICACGLSLWLFCLFLGAFIELITTQIEVNKMAKPDKLTTIVLQDQQ